MALPVNIDELINGRTVEWERIEFKKGKSGLLEESAKIPFSKLCRRMNIVEGPKEYLKPKNVGLLFFNDNPEQFFRGACIDVVEFQDEAGDSFREKTFRGPLYQQVRDALNYLKNEVIFELVHKVPAKAEAVRFFRRYRNRRIGDFLKELHLTEGRSLGQFLEG